MVLGAYTEGTLSSCRVTNNQAFHGGAVALIGARARGAVVGGTIEANNAIDGAGLFLSGASNATLTRLRAAYNNGTR